MIPILYESTETTFTTNGLGRLSDAVSCTVTEERNGSFELSMQYPINGIHYSDLAIRRIILAKPNQTDQTQPFRIYQITRPMSGIVTVQAQHISYDLSGYPVEPFDAYGAADAFTAVMANAVEAPPFTFSTDLTDDSEQLLVDHPCSIRSLFSNTGIGLFGGEWKFDRYAVSLLQARGQDRGVTLRYGKNLTSLEQDENCSEMWTAVMPYWVGGAGENRQYIAMTDKTVPTGTFDYVRILPLDCSSEYQEAPSDGQLELSAQQYITDNNLSTPKISLKVSFVQLEQTEEYKGLALLERVDLCDYVTIIFPKLGVNAKAEVVKVTYNVLLDRVDAVELGDAIQTIADTIATTTMQTNANTSGLTGATNTANGAATIAKAAAAQSLSVVSTYNGNTAEITNGHFRTSDGSHTITFTGASVNIDGDEHALTWVESGSHFYLGV